MEITIKENRKKDFKKVEFLVDDNHSKKLEKYEMISKTLNRSNFSVFCGKPGSGKSSLLTNFVKNFYKKIFHKIYLMIPKSSLSSMKDSIYKKLPENQIYHQCDEESMEELFSLISANSDAKEKSLLIISSNFC